MTIGKLRSQIIRIGRLSALEREIAQAAEIYDKLLLAIIHWIMLERSWGQWQ